MLPFIVIDDKREHIMECHSSSSRGFTTKFLTDDWDDIVQLISQTVMDPNKKEKDKSRKR